MRERLSRAIDGLADDPRPRSCVKLSGRDDYRIRVGDWRVVYEVDDARRRVIVVRVASPGRVPSRRLTSAKVPELARPRPSRADPGAYLGAKKTLFAGVFESRMGLSYPPDRADLA